MKFYLRERFANPFSGLSTTAPNCYVIGSQEDQVALFGVQQEALVRSIMEAYRLAATAQGLRPLNLIWKPLDQLPAPISAVTHSDLETPPVFSFELERETEALSL